MDRIEMYLKYNKELEQYLLVKPEDPEKDELDARKVAVLYQFDPRFRWIDIKKGNRIIGFLTLGYDLDFFPEKESLAICEAYILPEFRREGHMSSAVHSLLKLNSKTVYLEIFQANTGAQVFWIKTMDRNGYELVSLGKSISDTPGLIQYKFVKKGKR